MEDNKKTEEFSIIKNLALSQSFYSICGWLLSTLSLALIFSNSPNNQARIIAGVSAGSATIVTMWKGASHLILKRRLNNFIEGGPQPNEPGTPRNNGPDIGIRL